MSELPLISCIMPTRNRPRFVEQAIRYFKAYAYPRKELIIVDNSADNRLAELVRDDSNIWYDWRGSHPLSIGELRNIACRQAYGEIIALMDDDDIFRPHRLFVQIAPILEGSAQLSGLYMSLLLRTADMTLWSPSESVHAALFGYGLRCGTLLFRRELWEACPFPETSRGEDAAFLQAQLTRGKIIAQVKDEAAYICVRHDTNVSREPDGIEPPGWEQRPVEEYLSEDEQAFYRSLSEAEIANEKQRSRATLNG